MANHDLGPKLTRPLHSGSRAARPHATMNAGLWYDKFCDRWHGQSWSQLDQITVAKLDWIQTVTGGVIGCPQQLAELVRRQVTLAKVLGGDAITLTTSTRFATGLGREHPIEIGFAWHHSLGTPYLAGSGVKGLLRAFVREWIDGGEALADQVFGSDRPFHVGQLICFDAIPTQPVQLEADIMTPHYVPYYQGSEAPGDWHSPTPIPFLVVAAGQSFQFAFAPRTADGLGTKSDGSPITIDTVKEWLCDALHWLGAGAKTNAGYGTFHSHETPSSQPPATRAEFTGTLELVTPAFLAGADQQRATDCNLRPATLRGMLRWWWRTMHAGFLSVDQLRELEGKLWGNTNRGAAIRIVVQPAGPIAPQLYNKARYANMRPEQKNSEYGIPGADPRKTTQGLWYASFGMDETKDRGKPTEERKQRYFLDADTNWSFRIIAREVRDANGVFTAKQVLDQAQAALWLLCQFGGVGSKARKGFGSLEVTDLKDWSAEKCEQVAAGLRQRGRLPNEFVERRAESSALSQKLPEVTATFKWPNVWAVVDQIGFAYQAFAKSYKHRLEKKALGMPHRIGSPASGSFSPTGPVKLLLDEARRIRKEDNVRHASPIHIHVSGKPGSYTVRALAFPAAYLPDLATSRAFLDKFLQAFTADLDRRAALPPPSGPASSQRPNPVSGQPPTRSLVVNTPEITTDQLKQRMAELSPTQVLLKVERATSSGAFQCQMLRLAPNTSNGYQPDGGWTLNEAPTLAADVIVVAERMASVGKRGKFIEVFGRLPQKPQPKLPPRRI